MEKQVILKCVCLFPFICVLVHYLSLSRLWPGMHTVPGTVPGAGWANDEQGRCILPASEREHLRTNFAEWGHWAGGPKKGSMDQTCKSREGRVFQARNRHKMPKDRNALDCSTNSSRRRKPAGERIMSGWTGSGKVTRAFRGHGKNFHILRTRDAIGRF